MCLWGPGGGGAEVLFDTPWPQCKLPPGLLQEQVGTKTEKVLSLCLKTFSALKVTFDNADKFYIGNGSSVLGTNAACYSVDPNNIVMVSEIDGTLFFTPGGSLPSGVLQEQAWDLSVWPKYNPQLKQTVNLSISNLGPSDLQLTGIDYASLGLPKDTTYAQGEVTSITIDYGKVQLTYAGLPLLQQYMLGGDNIRPNMITALIFVQYLTTASGTPSVFVTYALVLYLPGDPLNEWNFFLYESTFSQAVSRNVNGRHLLVATAKNRAPPAACARACCKPASPLPKGCSRGGKGYPVCLKRCGCSCK